MYELELYSLVNVHRVNTILYNQYSDQASKHNRDLRNLFGIPPVTVQSPKHYPYPDLISVC